MLVALHRGEGFIAQAIQWQTRSVYSHASVVFEETGVVIEAREFKGVRSILWDEVAASGEAVDVFRVKGLLPEVEEAVGEFLQAQLGKPYDYTMVARFITRRQGAREESGKWFCSELVFAAFAQAGVKLLERIEPWAVSPGMLRLSTRLEEIEWPQKSTRGAKGEASGREGKWERGNWGNLEHPTSNAELREVGTGKMNTLCCDSPLTPALSPLRGEGGETLGVPGASVIACESDQVGKGSTESRPTGMGEQAGRLRYGPRDAGATSEGDWTGGGACPTTERLGLPPHVGSYEGKEVTRTGAMTILAGGAL